MRVHFVILPLGLLGCIWNLLKISLIDLIELVVKIVFWLKCKWKIIFLVWTWNLWVVWCSDNLVVILIFILWIRKVHNNFQQSLFTQISSQDCTTWCYRWYFGHLRCHFRSIGWYILIHFKRKWTKLVFLRCFSWATDIEWLFLF